MTETVVTALADAVRSDPGQPLVTFYDGATGERVELSAATFANWANKVANFLVDEADLEPGDTIAVTLPTHWLSTVALVGAWTAGLSIATEGALVKPDLSIVGPDARADPTAHTGRIVACSLRPLGGAFIEELPEGWYDFAREVPPQPDALMVATAPAPQDAALQVLTGPIAHVDLLAQAHETADAVGLARGGRLITDANPSRGSGLTAGLVAPLVVGASVVLTINCDAGARTVIAEQERVSSAFWLTG